MEPRLWSSCAFLMADMVDDACPAARFAARSWLQLAYSRVDRYSLFSCCMLLRL